MDIKTPIDYMRLGRHYKYRLNKTCCIYVGVEGRVKHEYFTLYKGYLWIKRGYQWDGATWFPDFKSAIKSSLLHDCLYQIMKLGLIDKSNRKTADLYFKNMCVKDGMWKGIALIAYTGVRLFGNIAIKFK